MVGIDSEFWSARRVVVTGHTGFKGGWLSLWLSRLGAAVHGYALDPPTQPNLFDVASINSVMASDIRADIACLDSLKDTLNQICPDVVFHLAAQSLVRESYHDPIGTLISNILGTANLLEAVRSTKSVKAVVLVTTDKVYQNHGLERYYNENDPLGGYDPYSASKAGAEIVTASYRSSFFGAQSGHPAHIATARAGNVIGGGDWATDRLVPDCLRSFAVGKSVHLRYPDAVRPWQHVLEPLAGYLLLAQSLFGIGGSKFANAWNFGPDTSGDATVGEIAEAMAKLWGNGAHVCYPTKSESLHEAEFLRLDSGRARGQLGWQPSWSLEKALEYTMLWQRAWLQGADMQATTLEQIKVYEAI